MLQNVMYEENGEKGTDDRETEMSGFETKLAPSTIHV